MSVRDDCRLALLEAPKVDPRDELVIVCVESIQPCRLCRRDALVYQHRHDVFRACPECGHIENMGTRLTIEVGDDTEYRREQAFIKSREDW